jgi:signal-transduction protein with cAMP-binding, CBS, and nucleotidyltransferase domain
MKTVKEVLDAKGHEFWSIQPGASVLDAARVMADKGIGALLVMRDGELSGLVSERDFTRKLVVLGRSPQEARVEEVMSTHVVCVRLEQHMEECMALMTEKRVRHLPVVDGEHVVGIVSIGDAVKSVIEHQKFIIEQLENYISS